MNKYLLSFCLFLSFFVTSVAFSAGEGGSTFSGLGAGTELDPYQITNWTTLNEARVDLTAYYKLMNDISSSTSDYSGIGDSWSPIGDDLNFFTGSFDGNSKTISDLVINLPETDYVGFIGYSEGNISNLGLINIDVIGNEYVGGLVGELDIGVVSGCYTTGSVVGNGRYVGGLVGGLWGEIDTSYSDANVSGLSNVGGLVGYQTFLDGYGTGEITKSYSTGDVSGESHSGGLVGVQIETTISNSYSTSDVTGDTAGDGYLGGLVGYAENSVIVDTYSSGFVTGGIALQSDYVGSLVGSNYNSEVNFSYWNIETSGTSTNPSGIGTTTSAMQSVESYTTAFGIYEWDFDTIWEMDSYPILQGVTPTEVDDSVYYTITYTTDGNGSVTGSSTQTVLEGSDTSSVTAVPNSRYRFRRWSDGVTSATRNDVADSNKTITAEFRKRSGNTHTSCTEYEYTDWSSCENGIQTRELKNSYPLGCIQNDSIIKQGCTVKEETTEDKDAQIEEEKIIKEEKSNKIVIFTKNLQFGDTDEEVKLLQKFLNSQGFIISPTGAGSIGKETNYFGLLTKQALVKYQEKYKENILTPAGFTRGTGYFGKMSRDHANAYFSSLIGDIN